MIHEDNSTEDAICILKFEIDILENSIFYGCELAKLQECRRILEHAIDYLWITRKTS